MRANESISAMTLGTAGRIALAILMAAGFAMDAHAQSLSASGPGTEAVTGISQPGSFPIKINKSGSYRLNSNLTVKKSGVDVIDVNASNVTIDLSGFTITGGVVAINTFQAISVNNTTVKNGTITGSSGGLQLGDGAAVTGVSIFGLTAAASTGFSNAITCTKYCRLIGNTIYNNTVSNTSGAPAAISAGPNSLILNNVISGTIGGSGIVLGTGGGSVITGNTANSNANDGILIGGSGVIASHNTADDNAVGLNFGAENGAYGDNILLNNTTTDVQGGTSLAGGNTNLCTGGVC